MNKVLKCLLVLGLLLVGASGIVSYKITMKGKELLDYLNKQDWQATYELRDSQFQEDVRYQIYNETMIKDYGRSPIVSHSFGSVGILGFGVFKFVGQVQLKVDGKDYWFPSTQLWVFDKGQFKCLNMGIPMYSLSSYITRPKY